MPQGNCPKCRSPLVQSANFCTVCGTSLVHVNENQEDPYLNTTIKDNFLVQKRIGAGSMGMVYQAQQLSLNKDVAIKVLKNALVHDEEALKRFEREARAASQLNHPHTIGVIDFGQCPDGSPFIAMEYIDGRDLAQIVNEEFPLDPTRILRLMSQTCDALEEAHAAGIIHRDLKLANIMVSQRRSGEEFVKVLDFGIAKINDPTTAGGKGPATRDGLVVGTPAFMSPEQIQGRNLDARSDIYSLGVVLFVLLTGRLPFQARSSAHMAGKILTENPPKPSKVRLDVKVHPIFDQITLKAMSRSPDARYASAHDMRRALENAKARINRPINTGTFDAPKITGAPTAAPVPKAAARRGPPSGGPPGRPRPAAQLPKSPVMATTMMAGDKTKLTTAVYVDPDEDDDIKPPASFGKKFALFLLVLLLAAVGAGAFFFTQSGKPLDAQGFQAWIAELSGTVKEELKDPKETEKEIEKNQKSINSASGKVHYGLSRATLATENPPPADTPPSKTPPSKPPKATKDPTPTPPQPTSDPNPTANATPKTEPIKTPTKAPPAPAKTPAEISKDEAQKGRALQNSNPAKALSHFKKAARYTPGNRSLWVQILRLAQRTGRTNDAKSACRRILKLAPAKKDSSAIICTKKYP